MDEQRKCLARNPADLVRWAWRCSLPAGHEGAHRAHHNHNTADRFQEWDLAAAERDVPARL